MRKIDYDKLRKFQVDDGGIVKFRPSDLAAVPGKKVRLKKDFDPDFTGGYHDKSGALEHVATNTSRLSDLQEELYAQNRHGLLIVFQAMDAAGKDGTIRHVMSGVNPQGCSVTSFKGPSSEELDHDYLWRISKALPRRGMIGIFNRSHYEEVLVTRVHPEFLESQHLPPSSMGKGIWKRRFREINNFENYLVDNGIGVLKFFLNISRDEQKRRFLARIDKPEKNWKFSMADVRERTRWDEYQHAFQEMLEHTSTDAAPWFVVPANNKWFARLVVSEIICTHLEGLGLAFPEVTDERRNQLLEIRRELLDD